MSSSLAANCGSRDSLNCRTRCGCNPCARQIRCTEETLMPTALAITVAVQWVVSPGGSVSVRATVRSRTASGSGGMREGRVLSRIRPSMPSAWKRSRQRLTAFLLFPLCRMIPRVPRPSAASNTIRARHTCFCGLLRSAPTASNRLRSPASNVIPSRILGPRRTPTPG